MMTQALLVMLILAIALPCEPFVRIYSRKGGIGRNLLLAAATQDSNKPNVIKDNEDAAVTKGLTHIKYNKYAPSPEEASRMSPEEFQATIYKRMKEAERKRREEQKGLIGGAVADDYLNSLSK